MTSSEPTYSSKRHIPELDGLRGLAILFVVCYHYLPKTIVSDFGWTGVDLFFVLSGYLISSRLIPYLNDSNLLRKFYWNRFLRIVPLYFSFILVFFGGWFIFNSKETLIQFNFYSQNWWQFFLFIQNWAFIQSYSENKVHLQHLWSIAVEEQIYIVFPLFLILIKRWSKNIFYIVLGFFLLVLISRCIYSFLYIDEVYEKTFWNTIFRTDSFLAGVMIYLISTESVTIPNAPQLINWLGIISASLLLCHILITLDTEKNNVFISTIGYSLIAISYASLLYLVLGKKIKLLSSIFLNKILTYIGKISFGIYIFHWPVYILGFAAVNKFGIKMNIVLSQEMKVAINIVCSSLITFLLSYISFKYYESYFLRWKERYK